MRSCALILVFASLVLGCKSEPPCEKLAKRNAECADAFVTVAKQRAMDGMVDRLKELPPAEREKVRAKLAARFHKGAKEVRETLKSDEFLNDCRQNWDDPEKMPTALKQELNRCLKMSDCASYAACFVESAKLSP